MKRKIMILYIFISSVSYAGYLKNNMLDTWGCVQMDYVAWKGGASKVFLPGIFFKDTTLYIEATRSNELKCLLSFKFYSQKLEYLIQEAYINIKIENYSLKIGKIYPFYDLEDEICPNNRIFMEKCSLKGFEEDNFFGAMFNYTAPHINFSYYLVMPELAVFSGREQAHKFSVFFRSFINIKDYNKAFHLGYNYKDIRRNPYENAKYTSVFISDTPAFTRPYSYLRTHYTSLPSYSVASFEFIGILKSLYLQSEISFIKAIWKDFNAEEYKSWYIQLAYLLTGEKHIYDSQKGTIINPIPNSDFGAIEIAIRYAINDTTSKGSLISGACKTDAKKITINLGLNWYLDKDIKMQFNYAYESFIFRLIDDKEIHSIGMGLRFSF